MKSYLVCVRSTNNVALCYIKSWLYVTLSVQAPCHTQFQKSDGAWYTLAPSE